MSEPIESISQGNYILHNIDAKKLYVQEPLFTANSGDAVYVGWRPDETVLWSGVSHTGNLSESVENFDTVKINYITDDGIQGMSEFVPAYGKNITLDSMYVASNSAVWIKTTNYTFSANTSFASYPFQTYVSNNKITATWYSNTANSTFRLTRVIGINRKEV